MKSLTDEQLMEIVQKNKADQCQMAFDQLYQRYAKTLVNYFYYALHKDNNKAQDFLHDLFLKLIENKASFKCSQRFKPWIFRMAINMCNNEFRREKVFNKYSDHLKNIEANCLFDNQIDYAVNNEMWTHIKQLPNEKRALIILRFKFNLSVKEMAVIFDCAEGTIKSRLFYTIKELSKLLKKQDYEF